MLKESFGKKGAIELSMTTIIVIIIGVTLLSLGLIWVKGTFKQIEDLSGGAFDKGEKAISDIFKDVNEPVSLTPPNLELAQDSLEIVDLIIANFGDQLLNVKAKVTSSDKFVECKFADTQKEESKEYKLNSGKQVDLTLIVEEKGGPLGVKVCNVEVPSLSDDNTASLVIEVVKKQGLFN